MKFIIFMIPEVYQPQNRKKLEAGFTPDEKMMEQMGKFNDELRAAGALISLDGFQPQSAGARLAFSDGKAVFTDGPAIETKEVVGGYWLLQAKSKQQVIEWFKRCPGQDGDVIEIRPIYGREDFPPEVPTAAQCA